MNLITSNDIRRDIEMVLMFSNQYSQRVLTNYAIRRLAVDYNVPLITNIQVELRRECRVLIFIRIYSIY